MSLKLPVGLSRPLVVRLRNQDGRRKTVRCGANVDPGPMFKVTTVEPQNNPNLLDGLTDAAVRTGWRIVDIEEET